METNKQQEKRNELLGHISVLKYNNTMLNNLLERGKTSLLDGIIDAALGHDVIVEQIHRNNKAIIELEKEFDEL
jgi:hypothetical protein